jgi:hypothetical protein
MPRKTPPPGYLTSAQALEVVGPMLYKYVKRGLLKRYPPPHGTYGYYKQSEVEKLLQEQALFYEQGGLEEDPSQENNHKKKEQEVHQVEFSRATPDDMEGVYAVAAQLFGHTTSAEARKPLVALCPDGNYIVRDNGQIVAYIHIQPLKPDRMAAFMRGEIRGSQIRADDLECFVPGKSADVLIKSVGAIGKDQWPRYYLRRLLLGAVRDMGSKGILISKIYATSETETGIAMSIHAQMKSLGKIGKDRYAFELDVATSELPLMQVYKRAYAEWQAIHSPQPATASHSPPASITQPTTHKPPVRISQPQKTAFSTVHPDLPEGTLTLREFAALLGINRATLAGTISDAEKKYQRTGNDADRVAHVAIPKPGREETGEMDRYFTPEQQDAYRKRPSRRKQQPQ